MPTEHRKTKTHYLNGNHIILFNLSLYIIRIKNKFNFFNTKEKKLEEKLIVWIFIRRFHQGKDFYRWMRTKQ